MSKGKRLRQSRKAEQSSIHLTAAQEKAMNREIGAQIQEADSRYWCDMDAAVMWVLHKEFGFGKKRLRRFFDAFSKKHEELRQYYEIYDSNNTWICRQLLKERPGVDIEAWEKEFNSNGQ